MVDQYFEVNLIENLTSEYSEELEMTAEYELKLESEDINLDVIVNSTMNWTSSPISKVQSQPIIA